MKTWNSDGASIRRRVGVASRGREAYVTREADASDSVSPHTYTNRRIIMAPRPQASAAGVLALLSENEPILKQHALRSLNTLVPQFWAEISESIANMCV
jgi:hypothetical protein